MKQVVNSVNKSVTLGYKAISEIAPAIYELFLKKLLLDNFYAIDFK